MARRVRGQLLDALLESLPDACLGVDRSGRIRFVNHKALQLLAPNPQAEWVDQSIWDVLPTSDFLKLLGQTVKSSVDTAVEQVVLIPPQSLCLCQLSPVHNEENRLQGWVAYLRDMTPVQQIEKGLDDLLRDVNQQLRTPITAIKGYVETLLEGAYQSPEVTRRFLQVINEETNRVTRLVLSLEEAANPNAKPADPTQLDLTPMLRRAATMFEGVAREKNLLLVCDLPERLPAVEVREDEIHKVVVNLLDNAVKCTGLKGHGQVKLQAEARRAGLEIHVSDTGVGIAEHELPKIFEKFYRVQDGPAAELGGTGLGLAVSKQITEEHGGQLEVRSQVTQGSTFTIRLPFKR
ncbi:MAG: PAS domain-containing protein [Candidatus Eremiobacteraeota bacterium]|nr:PAS domain-containing protein [Candidatus Eremiobacteraeota bacterium]MCW5868952.1 PAS domain-containing protein [Candidatus Eremiobacteraeota bacterium]